MKLKGYQEIGSASDFLATESGKNQNYQQFSFTISLRIKKEAYLQALALEDPGLVSFSNGKPCR